MERISQNLIWLRCTVTVRINSDTDTLHRTFLDLKGIRLSGSGMALVRGEAFGMRTWRVLCIGTERLIVAHHFVKKKHAEEFLIILDKTFKRVKIMDIQTWFNHLSRKDKNRWRKKIRHIISEVEHGVTS